MKQPGDMIPPRATAPEEMRHKVLDLVRNKRKTLPTLPVIIHNLIRLAGDDRTGVSELAAFIGQDQAIANKVLRVANSSYYGASRRIDSISRAIAVVGFDEIVGLAVGIGVIPLFSGKDTAGVLDMQALWRHSLACTFAARLLGNRAREQEERPLFLIALLHDIGKVLFALYFPEIYRNVIAAASAVGRDLVEVEREHLGIDHARLAQLFQEFWNLPESLVTPIRYHHAPESCPMEFRNEAMAVALADHLAKAAGIGGSANAGGGDTAVFQRELGYTPEELARYAEELSAQRDAIDDFFNVLTR